MSKKPPEKVRRRIENRKARHDYHIHQVYEAGIALTGSEVKSLRAGAAQLTDSFVRIHGTTAVLYGCNIDRYPAATDRNHEPKRTRQLLLHRREVRKMDAQLVNKGTTIVPLAIFFSDRGLAKVEIAVVTGKREYDKRETLRKQDAEKEIGRAMRTRDRSGR